MMTSFIPQISSDEPVRGTTLYVGGTGTGNYSTIQSAIDAASSGDTVFVYNGTYYENVIVDKSIDLIGENNENTIIDGGGSHCVQVSSNHVTISSFKLIDGHFCIEIYEQNNNVIINNKMQNSYVGIGLSYSCFNKIIGNTVVGSDNRGIWISQFSNNNTVFDNIINWNDYWSLTISFYSKNNTIMGNTFTTMENNIQISYNSNNNKIHHNNLLNNMWGGNDECSNFWDNGYPSGGNFWYWGDLLGEDANNDGIGDNPLHIYGGNNYDYYPLMHLFGGIRELPSGWSFISLPANHTADIHSIMFSYNDCLFEFQDAVDNGVISPYLFGWNRTIQSYQFVDFLEAGFGCWIYIYEPCEIWYQYDDEFGDGYIDSYITKLETNWNLVGVPFYETVGKTSLLLNDVPWDTAVSNGWISDYVFDWDEPGQTYVFSDTFIPTEAYWLYAYQPCVLKRNS